MGERPAGHKKLRLIRRTASTDVCAAVVSRPGECSADCDLQAGIFGRVVVQHGITVIRRHGEAATVADGHVPTVEVLRPDRRVGAHDIDIARAHLRTPPRSAAGEYEQAGRIELNNAGTWRSIGVNPCDGAGHGVVAGPEIHGSC